MADLNYAAFSFTAKPAISVPTKQTSRLYSHACHAPSPAKVFKLAKPRRRRNSLLPKILPKPRETPRIDPITPREAPVAHQNDEGVDADSVEIDERVSVANEEQLLLSGASGMSLAARYGLYFIGAFLFQTVLAVWIFGSSKSNHTDEVSDRSDSDRKASPENGVRQFSGSNAGPSGEIIEEIRAMARRARRDEKSVGQESSSSRSKMGVEKAIGNRLRKLKKSVNGGNDRPLGNGSLVFRKKLGLRSSLAELGQSSKEKGFAGSEKKKTSNGRSIGNKASGLLEGEDGDVQNSRLSQYSKKKLEGKRTRKENGGTARKSGNGVLQEGKIGRASATVANAETTGEEGNSIRQEVDKKLASFKLIDKPSIAADMWWLDLPYVLVVLMHRDSDPEGYSGLYSLKLGSEAVNQGESSYTVAFEDRGDANNFCFLLGSFFEDLGDVRAGVIPLSVKELQEAASPEDGDVIVVRKGQLKLYAGQPLEDVEMALRALVEETQSVR